MRLHLFFLLYIIGFQVFAQTSLIVEPPSLTNGDPEQHGISYDRLARIDRMCQNAISDGQVPGMVALIARDGKIVYHKAFGTADPSSNRPYQTNDIFRIASQTKAITATAVMMLWEEAHFQLDDPIHRWIPEFKEMKVLDTINADGTYSTVPADKPISIRHLLTHSSGLGYGVIDGNPLMKKIYREAGITDLFTTEKISIEESVEKLAALPLHHQPGDAFTYSEGLDVMGYLIEIISGMPLDEFFRSRIFEPLGMEDTWFYLPENKHYRLVPVLQKENDEWKHFPVTFYDPDYPIKGAKRFFSGGAGLSSTAKDYATFLQMYLNDGELNGKRILSRTTVKTIMSEQMDYAWGGASKYYSLAFGVVSDGGVANGGLGSKGTFDWGGYFNTQYFADPEENVIGVLLKQTQGDSGDQTGWKFRQLVFAAIDD